MLIVTQGADGSFSCVEKDATGMCIEGRGASVLEAVGSWAIYSSTVQVKCSPPAVLQEFAITNQHSELKFKPPASR